MKSLKCIRKKMSSSSRKVLRILALFMLLFVLGFTSLDSFAQNLSKEQMQHWQELRKALILKLQADSLHKIGSDAFIKKDYKSVIVNDESAAKLYWSLYKNEIEGDPLRFYYEYGLLDCWNNLAYSYYYTTDYPKAIAYNDSIIEYNKKQNSSPVDFIANYKAIGYAYIELNEFAEALRAFRNAYNCVKQVADDDYNQLSAQLLLLQARCYLFLEKKDSALYLGNRGLDIYDKLHEQDLSDSIYANAIIEVANLYGSVNEPEIAEKYYRKSLSLIESYSGKTNENYIDALSLLCSTLESIGEFDKAEQGYNEIISFYQGKGDIEGTWSAKSALVGLLLQECQYNKALEKSHSLLEEIRLKAPDSYAYEFQLEGEAQIYQQIGDIDHAISLFEEATNLAITRGNLVPMSTRMSSLLNAYTNRATSKLISAGDANGFNKCIDYGSWCLNKLSGDTPNYIVNNNKAFILTLMSKAYTHLKKNEEAIDYALMAKDTYKKTCAPSSNFYLYSLLCLQNAYADNGNYDKALDYASEALSIYRNSSDVSYRDYPRLLNSIALLYGRKKKYKEAIDWARKALESSKSQSDDYCESLRDLAFFSYLNSNYDDAFNYEERALNFEKTNTIESFRALNSTSRMSYWSHISRDFTDDLPLYVQKLQDKGQGTSILYDYSALFAKGMLLEADRSVLQIIEENKDSIALQILKDIYQCRKKLSLALSSNNDSLLARDLSQNLFNLEEKLSSRVSIIGDITQRLQITWHDVQNALRDSDVAIEFLNFDIGGDKQYIALTLTKEDDVPKLTALFKESQVDSLIQVHNLTAVGEDAKEILSEIGLRVWNPLKIILENKKNIYFSPSGILHDVGIEYSNEVDSFNVYRISSTREIAEKKKVLGANNNNVVLYGGLDYYLSPGGMEETARKFTSNKIKDDDYQLADNSRSLDFTRSLRSAGALPYTKEEVLEIGKMLDDNHLHHVTLTDDSGTEESFKSLSGHSPKIIHFATHGFYWTNSEGKEHKDLKFLELESNENKVIVNPEDMALSRSGLLLSGANNILDGESIPNDLEDGILTAREIAETNLQGLDLVVLSACQTGLGDIRQGEGVLGLQRGFKKAGAKSILMSLWEVDDHATQILMKSFYENLIKGKTKYQALKEAQIYLREYNSHEYDNPKYWASFILLDAID